MDVKTYKPRTIATARRKTEAALQEARSQGAITPREFKLAFGTKTVTTRIMTMAAKAFGRAVVLEIDTERDTPEQTKATARCEAAHNLLRAVFAEEWKEVGGFSVRAKETLEKLGVHYYSP